MIALVAAGVCIGTLLSAGLTHVLGRARFRAELDDQRLIPTVATPVIAVVIPTLELAIGIAGAIVVLGSNELARLVIFGAAAGLFASYLLFLGVLRAKRPLAPCACPGVNGPLGKADLLRPGMLCAWSVTAMIASDFRLESGQPAIEAVMAALGACTIGLLTWMLPSALGEPIDLERSRLAQVRGEAA